MRAVGLAIVSALVMAAPAAANFPDNSAALFSNPGDWVGKGLPRLYTDLNASLSVTGTSADLTFQITGNDGSRFDMRFAARSGSTLKPGVYDRVERAASRSANRPGMEISGNGAGCNTITGSFEVKDIAVDATGVIQRAQILYEQHCEGSQPALFGEVRWGEPPEAAAVTTPSALNWPDAAFGTPSFAIPVALLVTREMRIESVSITGPHADDFSVDPVFCGGTSCPDGLYGYGDTPGTSVRFAPRRAGTRSATLRIVDSDGVAYEVPLRGYTSG